MCIFEKCTFILTQSEVLMDMPVREDYHASFLSDTFAILIRPMNNEELQHTKYIATYLTWNISSAVPEPGLHKGRLKNESVYGETSALSYDCNSLYTCSCKRNEQMQTTSFTMPPREDQMYQDRLLIKFIQLNIAQYIHEKYHFQISAKWISGQHLIIQCKNLVSQKS